MVTMEEVRKLASAGKYKRVPVSKELYADQITPVQLLRILQNESGSCFLFESGEDPGRWGRYTFLGYDPVLELSWKDGQMQLKGQKEKSWETQDPKEEIRRILKEYRSPALKGLPPFTGGFAGYFSAGWGMQGSGDGKIEGADPEGLPDANLMLFDKVIAFDHFRQKLFLMVNVEVSSLEVDYSRAEQEIRRVEQMILLETGDDERKVRLKSGFSQRFTREQYCQMAEKGKKDVLEGKAMGLVLSNQMEADMEGSLTDAYRVLRAQEPSPYMVYLTNGELEIIGTSPETLLKLTDGEFMACPLTGSRPRGESRKEDMRLERELLADEKERALHNLQADIKRDEIGQVSRIGSVKAERMPGAERSLREIRLGTAVSGKIRKGCDALDGVDAVLPACGNVGVPRARACRIVQALEQGRRGIFGGAVGYLGLSGNMDLCALSRLALAKDGKVFVCGSGAVGPDSEPMDVYQECQKKARAVVNALETAQKGEGL